MSNINFENIKNKYSIEDFNNCVVIALTETSGLPYEMVNIFVRHVLNRSKNGTVLLGDMKSSKKMFKNIGLYFKEVKIECSDNLTTLTKKYTKGKYLLFTNCHVMPLVEGTLKDVSDLDLIINSKIVNVFKVSD